jgi:hypothetical protein
MAHGYPSWRYHATEAPKRIVSAEQEMDGWYDSPKKAQIVAEPAAVEPAIEDAPRKRRTPKKEIA